uniref:F-box/LRR-repeat protein n=1 Tax=Noccaea caerulescens TaxID=107243 RepID=A0A1J3FLU4_NOCCA
MDRVSKLPDELLYQIMSFLPTKDAAVTSVLSKRWLNLWKFNPNLEIDDSVFLHPEDGKGERAEIRQSFVDFVDRVLARQGDSPIKNFSLKCITGVHPDIVNRWICNVLKRGVSDLDLFTDFSDEDTEEDSYHLPEELFFSRTLVKLKLTSEHCVDWWCLGGTMSYSFSLPMLKSLNIDSELFLCSDDIEEFIPSFPVLEELRMANMEWNKMDVTVSSASLRKLNLHGNGCEGSVNPRSVSFDTPNLLFLNYFDLVAEDYPVVNMKKLVEAVINLTVTDDQVKRLREPNNDLLEEEEDDEDDAVLHFGNVVKLMNGIQNVQRLHLCVDTLEVLALCCESMPVFNNLKFLGVAGREGRGWQAMPALLRNCPRLETIIVRGLLHDVTEKCGDACPCISSEDKGLSLKSCPVNRLEIQGFRGTMREMAIIKHFLDYFPSLKRFDVFVEDNEPTQLRNNELSNCVTEMFALYDKLFPSCNVQLLVSDFLEKKWKEQGHI